MAPIPEQLTFAQKQANKNWLLNDARPGRIMEYYNGQNYEKVYVYGLDKHEDNPGIAWIYISREDPIPWYNNHTRNFDCFRESVCQELMSNLVNARVIEYLEVLEYFWRPHV